MVDSLRSSGVASCLVAILGCTTPRVAREATTVQRALPVFVGVTNESAVTRRLELRVNNVVVVDTVVGRPRDMTGRVLADTIRLGPGTHDLVLVDHLSNRQFRARLTVQPGPMCIFIGLIGPRTDFHAGHYECLFA